MRGTVAREYGLKPKSANHSDLMKAKTSAKDGELVNFCPFGCDDDDLDEHGYCHHMVGVTVGDTMKNGEHVPGKKYEPIEMCPDGKRRTKVEYVLKGVRKVPNLPLVQKGDHLERITSNFRVYRNVGPLIVPRDDDESDEIDPDDEIEAEGD